MGRLDSESSLEFRDGSIFRRPPVKRKRWINQKMHTEFTDRGLVSLEIEV
jgi:hypothetical protein